MEWSGARFEAALPLHEAMGYRSACEVHIATSTTSTYLLSIYVRYVRNDLISEYLYIVRLIKSQRTPRRHEVRFYQAFLHKGVGIAWLVKTGW